MNYIDVEFYLVIGQKIGRSGYADGRPSIRTAKSQPATAAHEIAVAMSLRLPLALFKKPSLSAHIIVPPDQAPFEITPEVQHNIAKAVQEQTGIVLRIEAPPVASEPDA